MRRFLAIDCGSTTTKATIFMEQIDGSFRVAARSEVPTTVEAPVEDVTVGVRAAILELEHQLAISILHDSGLCPIRKDNVGVDGFYATSSAGGGLQIIVAGVMKKLTAESAERAALGAGALVADVIAIDDGRLPHERLERIYDLRPDMVLISGGVDGGNIAHVVQLGELFYAAGIRPRFAPSSRLPVIFAGNKEARKYIADVLGSKADLRLVENLRPVMEQENSGPTRAAIQDTFMNHVMLHAPQYRRLSEWVSKPIIPTPSAVGQALLHYALTRQANLLACDIGGATTDIFSVIDGELNRTVSANLGMSYSINNVLAQAGMEQILNFIPFPLDEDELQDLLANKMTRPTSIPETASDLLIEQVCARLAISLSLRQHQHLITDLKGVAKRRDIADIFEQLPTGQTRINLLQIDMIVGSGSVLSLAPRREQAGLILLDAFQPQGVTEILLDNQFLLPHVGAIANDHPAVAWDILRRSSILNLGTCVAPVGPSHPRFSTLARVDIVSDSYRKSMVVRAGELTVLPLPFHDSYQLTVIPAGAFNVGAGPGKPLTKKIEPGLVGLMLDGRGRPLVLPAKAEDRFRHILDSYVNIRAFSREALADFARRGGVDFA